MTRTIILSLLCALTIGLRAADYTYLVFTTTGGTQTAVTAADLTITFDNGYMTAASGSETLATIALSDLASMEFSNETSGIETTISDSLITDQETVIYDLNGRQMPQGAALPKGIYILKNSKRTIKMQVK